MNRSMIAHARKTVGEQVRAFAGKAAAVVGGMFAAGAAMAQTATPTSAATGKLTSAESDITSILVILVGVVFLFVLYSLIKKAK